MRQRSNHPFREKVENFQLRQRVRKGQVEKAVVHHSIRRQIRAPAHPSRVAAARLQNGQPLHCLMRGRRRRRRAPGLKPVSLAPKPEPELRYIIGPVQDEGANAIACRVSPPPAHEFLRYF